METIREYSRELYHEMAGRRVCLRVTALEGLLVQLRPHDVLLNEKLLDVSEKEVGKAADFLTANLHAAFYHVCHPEEHVTQARLANLHFLWSHPDLMAATIERLERDDFGAEGRFWLAELREAKSLLLLERFWRWFGSIAGSRRILRLSAEPGPRARSGARETLLRYAGVFAKEQGLLKSGLR